MTTTPTYRRATEVSVSDAAAVCEKSKVDPTDLAASGPSLLKGTLTDSEVDRLADNLIRASGAAPNAQLEGMLAATVGARVAKRLLDRRQAGDSWSRIVTILKQGTATAELSGADAIKLAKELRTDDAINFKDRLARDPTPSGIKTAIELYKGEELSPNAIITIVRDFVSDKSLAVRHGAEQELQRFAVTSDLSTVFKRAGDAAQLRAMPAADLINDEILFLDAFEVFVHTNDTALKSIADSTQFALDALREGDDFSVSANGQSLLDIVDTLKDEVNRMLDWQSALAESLQVESARERRRDGNASFATSPKLLREAADTVLTKLDDAARNLEQVFSFKSHGTGFPNFSSDLAAGLVPAQIAEPYEAFTAICSKSKATVEVSTIETVEELIRILHREVAQMFAEHVRRFANQNLTLRKSHSYTQDPGAARELKMTYVGSCTKETLAGTPMAIVRDTVLDYVRSSRNGGYEIGDAVLTDKTLAFDTLIGCHRGRLAVTYDSIHNLYFVEWGMQEPGSGDRIRYAKELFEKEGYTHNVEGYKHSASRKITPENIKNEMLFLMFVLDNLQDVDISKSNFTPTTLRTIFEGWLNHRTVKPKVSDGATLQEKIAQIAEQDPHLLQVAAAGGYSYLGNTCENAIIQFYGTHFDLFSRPGASKETVTADLKAIADYFHTELYAKMRKTIAPQTADVARRDSRDEERAFSRVASAIAGASSREAVAKYFQRDDSAQICGPIYQST